MARSRSQTAPGKAVYLLREALRVPTREDEHFRWIAAGEKASADELQGLNVDALEQGGFIEKVAAEQIACEACLAHGTKAEQKELYTLEELRAHYAGAHPGLALPEEA